ncbi:MAG TPA: hypothetical protein VFR86_05385 [Burkholderiaceae bacterium]|nr:hypothetical protein [Burkholderiaceae bacterium]
MKTFRRLFVASTAIALLSACGGGGGDGGTPPPAGGPAPAPAVTITSNNQTALARSTLGGGLGLGNARVLAAQPGARALAVLPGSAPQMAPPLAVIAQRGIDVAVRPRPSAAAFRPRALAVTTETEACGFSGSITIAFDDRDNDEDVSAGDDIAVTFNQCRESAEDLINGTVVVSITSVSAASASRLEFAGAMAFQSVTVAFGSTTATLNGSLAVAFLETTSLSRLTLTVGAGGLTLTIAQPGYSDTIIYASGARIDVTSTVSPAATSVSMNGSFSASSIGGTVTVATLQPVRQLDVDVYPSSGQILVTGAGGSRLRITVLSNTTVRLELDADGDGTFEAASQVAWSTLLAA